MRKIIIYIIVCFFVSCINRTEEIHKLKNEAFLCILASEVINDGNPRGHTIGSMLCETRLHEKVQEIDKKDYFKSDDH